MTTISASGTTGIYLLSPSYTNPVVVNRGVTISVSGALPATIDLNAVYAFNGAWTVVNDGSIASASYSGVYLGDGGSVTNAATASISGYDGVNIGGAIGSVINSGTIAGSTTHSIGVLLAVGGSVTNQSGGTISGYTGVNLTSGGTITNAASASITGVYQGVVISGGAGSVVNHGYIAGTGFGGVGIILGSGGTITNEASASITGKVFGVDLSASGTLTNAGTIVGNAGTAVVFGGAGSNLLVLEPGYALSGIVIGETSAINTLELASAASAGTLSGLGAEFVGFVETTIDADASWVFNGANTIEAGTTLTELSGAALTVGGTLVNDGSIAIEHSTLVAGGLTGAGLATIDAGSVLDLQGAVASGETIMFAGSGTVLTLDTPGSVAATVTNFAPDETIDLEGISPASVSYSGGLLSFSSGSFALALESPGTVTASANVIGAGISVQVGTTGSPVPPTITGTAAGQAITDQETIAPFSTVTISDLNISQTETVTVTLSAPADGLLSDPNAVSDGSTIEDGVYSVTGSATAVTAELRALVFTPTAHQVAPGQAITTTFTITDIDAAGASASDSTTTVIATAVAVAPTITGTVSGQRINDTTPISPFSKVTIADANAGQTETVTVTLSAAENGILSNPVGGSYNATTGIYTVTGNAAVVTAVLDGLVFIPTTPKVSAATTVTTDFTIEDTDTAGASATDATTTVIVSVPLTKTIASNGTTTLVQVGTQFILEPGGVVLKYNGSPVTTGEFGPGVTPVGAVQTGNGYEVAWSLGADEYVVWNTDLNGNYTSSATGILLGNSLTLEAVEANFGDGVFSGAGPIASTTTIAINGVTNLVQVGNLFELNPAGGGTGPLLEYQGGFVAAGVFGTAVTPVGAEQTTSGYEVAWSLGGNEYVVWNTDANGNYTSSATGILSGSSYALEDLELSFGEDLNGDGTIGPTTTPIASNGVTRLVQVANQYALENASGGIVAWLSYQGSAVTAGVFGTGVTPVGAKQTADGYEVVFGLGSNEYVVWNTGLTGNYTSNATGIVSGNSSTLEAVEANFGDGVFSGAGSIASTTTIASSGTTTLVQVGNLFELNPAIGTGPLLEYQGSLVTAGEFGAAVTPVGAKQTGNGYEVVWSLGANEFVVWNTDLNGNYTSSATGIVSGASAVLEAVETNFGDGVVSGAEPVASTTTIATNGTTTLAQVGNLFELNPASGGTGPLLEYQGSFVTAGQFGATVTPVGAVQTASGYEVAFGLAGNEYVVWNTDANGDYMNSATGVVSGSSYALEELELTFGEDLNGDRTIGPTATQIASNGVTRLMQVANQYALENGSGGILAWVSYQGSAVTAGQFGTGVTPVGAVQTATGYEVAWSLGANEFVVWNTDRNGNYTTAATSIVAGGSLTLEAVEANFGETFPGGGSLASTTTIETNGTTTLVQVGNLFELNPTSGTGPLLEYQGNYVTAGEFGAGVTPVGAKQTGNGYEVVFGLGSNEYVVWNTDLTGNYTSSATGIVSGNSSTLEAVEASFGETFPGGGSPASTTTIAINGTTALVQVGNLFELNPTSGAGSLLEYQGSFVTAGEFGASVTPVGAKQTGNGYEVAWSLGSNEYVVWNTDANGNYTTAATGVLSGSSLTLEAVEANFSETFPGGGSPASTTTIATNGTTTLVQVGNLFALNPTSGTGPLLEYQGNYVAAGEFGASVTPVGAEKTASGYEVAWSLGGDEYVVWNTDSNGNYTSEATGVVSGQSFALEDLEPAFGEDLNGDGRLSVVLVTSAGPGNTVDLADQTQATTMNLGGNTASVSAGLNAPSLAFIGTPDAITLGSSADTIEYALAPSSGIETIAGFILGQDELNIDLMGAANSALQLYNTTVGGAHAIAIASSADPTHGLVLLNMPTSDTAAALLASHVTFSGGHALIS